MKFPSLVRAGAGALLISSVVAQRIGPSAPTPGDPHADPKPAQLTPVWTKNGSWQGVVAADAGRGIYAIALGGRCEHLDTNGKKRRAIAIHRDARRVLRHATFVAPGATALLLFGRWSDKVSAYDRKGKLLWSYGDRSGIDDVWTHDLNGDGLHEVIVGFNGGTGLHVLDGEGQVVWKTNEIGNVWHVCAGDVLGTGKPQIVTTSARGRVHVFAADGTSRHDLEAGIYATMVRVGKVSENDEAATIFAAGTKRGGSDITVVTAMTGGGQKRWSRQLRGAGGVVAARAAPGKPWLAVATQTSDVHVIDTRSGKTIASAKLGGAPVIAWTKPRRQHVAPLLVVANGSRLQAFRVPETD